MSDRQTWDVAIVGAGVIGLSCAFELARRRQRVVVIERDQPGAHASRIAAGLLSTVGLPLGEDDDLFPLKLDSLRRFPQFVAKVESLGRTSSGFRTDGTLWVARDSDEDEQLDQLQAKRSDLRLHSRRVTAREVASFEPELAPGSVSGLLIEEDVQIDPRRLLSTLERGCQTVRANILSSCEVRGGEYDGSSQLWTLKLNSSVDGGDALQARRVLLTAGPWCDQIADAASESAAPLAATSIAPVKGQLLRMRGPALIERVIQSPTVALAQRRDGELIVASTKEPEAGWDLTATQDARDLLLDRGSEQLPALRELDLVEHSVGLRPAVHDHLPVIGPAGRPGLWIAAGHYRHGILLAPSTAHWLAEAMESGETPAILQPYGIERLASAETKIEVTLNGEPAALTNRELTEALCEIGYDPEQPGIAVAINMSVVPRSEWSQTTVADGDHIDIVGAKQGG